MNNILDEIYGDDLYYDDLNFMNNNLKKNIDKQDFRHILHNNLNFKDSLLKEIDKETKNFEKYFFKKIEEFPKIFEGKNLSSLEESFNYLESISIPSKCICAGIIDTIPGWRCEDCSIYENSIYCSKCYINSKEEHKNHKVEFLNASGGMCDCGDPDSLSSFCCEHCGPYKDQNEIDEYIRKVFPQNILKNIQIFLDDFFYQFSKYLILTEKCKLFYDYILEKSGEKSINKNNISNLKDNFGVVFKNCLNFLRKITENNLAMLHLMVSYFLKNNFNDKDKESQEHSLTTHSCIKLSDNNIEILYKDKNAIKNIFSPNNISGVEKHKCECPFLRLFVSNYRSNIKSLDANETEDEKFFLSFAHNLFMRKSMCIMLFFLYKEVLFNFNSTIMYIRSQNFMEDALITIAKTSNLIEDSFDFLYEYIKIFLEKQKTNFDLGVISKFDLDNFLDFIKVYMFDSKYFSKPIVRKLMLSKIFINKRIIDILSLFHYKLIFKSIVPHPEFQLKKEVVELIDAELFIFNIINMTIFCTDWDNFEIIKDIFNHFVDKILSLKKTHTLGKNEFTYHFPIYRYFGTFINYFCFNYALINNTDLFNAIEYVKNHLFRSKNEMNQIISIILDEYFKFYGFVIGIRSGFFNYYEIQNYNYIYFHDMRYLIKDVVLLKYLLSMLDEPLKLDYILEKSDVENIYQIFQSIFQPTSNSKPQKKEKTGENEGGGFFGFFKHPISYIQSFFFKKDKDKKEENNFIIQWRRILETIISIIKDDSTILSDILKTYGETVSLKTKNNFFEKIKNNKYLMLECRNMLKQSLIQKIIANGNLIDLKQIKQTLYEFYFTIFDDKEFNEILDEVTFNKINGEKKQFSIKDSALKYLDMNYYLSPMIRAKAELYITDFKKDMFKMYNSYYYSPSEFTFDFYNKAYQNILLSEKNIELLINILDTLLKPINEEKMKNYNPNSIRAIMLPVIFNILSMVGNINSTEFYNFKTKNEILILRIIEILNGVINANKEKKFLDSDLADNINELINQLISYKIIRRYIEDGEIKLNDKSYRTDLQDLKMHLETNFGKNNINSLKSEDKEEGKKNKIKNMKDKLKNKMKSQNNKFINKIQKNKDMKNIIEDKDKKEDINNDNEEIMCFYCRNSIYLNSFDKPYGKLGLVEQDYFNDNSIISTLISELDTISEKEENILIKECSSNIIKNMQAKRQKKYRINSCGHYFHHSCFLKGKTISGFKCILCEKIQNILIPPLNNFYQKENFLKPVLKIKDLFEIKETTKKNNISNVIKEDKNKFNANNKIIKENFKDIVLDFLNDIIGFKLNKCSKKKNFFENYIEQLLPKFQNYINLLINLIYSNAITFYKHQQIVIIKNLFLSLRYLMYINYINLEHITEYIFHLIDEIHYKYYNDLLPYDIEHYNQLFDKLLICFSVLFDYDELKNIFIYIIYMILPYMSFFSYLKNLVFKNNLYTLEYKNYEKDMTLDNLKKYIKENNSDIINHFIKYLHKFYIIKLITNFENNDDKISHNLKNLSNEELFSLLNMEELYKSLLKNEKDEIIFSDLFIKIKDLLSKCEYYNKELLKDYDKVSVFNSMINQMKNIKNESSKLVEPDFIIQFIPYEFKLISLDNQIFDFIEKCIFKKCIICNNETKYYLICLICGQKVCTTNNCNSAHSHVKNCCGKLGMFINITDMRLYFVNSDNRRKALFPLYINESGVGPDLTSKGRDFKLSKENYETALKEFISLDVKIN